MHLAQGRVLFPLTTVKSISIAHVYMKEHVKEEENTMDGLSARAVISLLVNRINFSEEIACSSQCNIYHIYCTQLYLYAIYFLLSSELHTHWVF